MNKKRKTEPTKITIEFANPKAAEHFVLWLCEAGEQDYWEWQKYREEEEDGDITVIQFHYHGMEDETKPINDPDRYGDFMCDDTIRTTCGRLDHS